MALFKFWASYKPTADRATYVGKNDEVILDAVTNKLYHMDGVTPGGTEITSEGGGTETYNVKNVTGPTAEIEVNDYYIGINYAGPVTITAPHTYLNGFKITIKDESGAAATNNITLDFSIDNDPGGAVLAINNGSLIMIYNNGSWRIV